MTAHHSHYLTVVWDGRAAWDDGFLLTGARPNADLYNALLEEAPLILVTRPLRDGAPVYHTELNRPIQVLQVRREPGPRGAFQLGTIVRSLKKLLPRATGLLAIGPGLMATISLLLARRYGIARSVYLCNTIATDALAADDRYGTMGRSAFGFALAALERIARLAATEVGAVSHAALAGYNGFVMPEIAYTTLHRDLARATETTWVQRATVPEVLYVGRLEQIKGPDLAILAISMLENCRLTIVGDGTMRERLEYLVGALNMKGRVQFLSTRPHDEVIQMIRRCDCVIVPSRSEAFGLVALEAAILGTPAVVSRVGGLPEALLGSRSGLVVDPEPAAMAEGVTTALRLSRSALAESVDQAMLAQGWTTPEALARWLVSGQW